MIFFIVFCVDFIKYSKLINTYYVLRSRIFQNFTAVVSLSDFSSRSFHRWTIQRKRFTAALLSEKGKPPHEISITQIMYYHLYTIILIYYNIFFKPRHPTFCSFLINVLRVLKHKFRLISQFKSGTFYHPHTGIHSFNFRL